MHPQPIARGDYPAFYGAVPDWLAHEAAPPVDPGDSAHVLAVVEVARRGLDQA